MDKVKNKLNLKVEKLANKIENINISNNSEASTSNTGNIDQFKDKISKVNDSKYKNTK